MSDHSELPWFTNSRFEIGPRFRTDDQSDGMLDAIASTFGVNAERDARYIVLAANHFQVVKAALEERLDVWLLTRKLDDYPADHWSQRVNAILSALKEAGQ